MAKKGFHVESGLSMYLQLSDPGAPLKSDIVNNPPLRLWSVSK